MELKPGAVWRFLLDEVSLDGRAAILFGRGPAESGAAAVNVAHAEVKRLIRGR